MTKFDPNKPAFEIKTGEYLQKVFRIYADGRIEGFEHLSPCVIVNRIPQLLVQHLADD